MVERLAEDQGGGGSIPSPSTTSLRNSMARVPGSYPVGCRFDSYRRDSLGVTQLDRVSVFETDCWGFESPRLVHPGVTQRQRSGFLIRKLGVRLPPPGLSRIPPRPNWRGHQFAILEVAGSNPAGGT